MIHGRASDSMRSILAIIVFQRRRRRSSQPNSGLVVVNAKAYIRFFGMAGSFVAAAHPNC
jgi:hypothetical protein